MIEAPFSVEPSRLPIVVCEFLFSGRPVIDILTIQSPARLVEVEREPSDLVT